MKLTIFLLAMSFSISAKTLAQETVTLSFKNAPLESVLKQIEKQTGYQYFFVKEWGQDAKAISIEVHSAPLDAVLNICFQQQPFTYQIVQKTIVIKRRQEARVISDPTPNAHGLFDFQGNVTDENGQPLAGATVKLKDGKVVAFTDERGNFKIKDINNGATIQISYTGYSMQDIQIKGQSSLNISLKRATNKLDVVQILAYGTSTQRLGTGNVTTVTSKEIEEQPVSNLLAALEGRVPGLVIAQTTGLPGGSFTVQIRGKNSIASGVDPFYVIDGVPYNSQLPTALLNSSLNGGSPMNFLNPYDIESIEVLKDADATSIYGSRAANGAILITTKKGKPGTMKFDINVSSGFTEPAHALDILNAQQYLAMRHEAFKNDGETPGPGDHDINGDWDTTRYTNWTKVLTNKPAHYTDAEANVSGGNLNTQYLIGVGYNRQTTGFPTLLPGDGGDKRGSAHFNINTFSPNKRFKLTLTGSYVADKNTVQSVDFSSVRLNLPTDAPPIFNPDGSLNWAPLIPGQPGTWVNPYTNLHIKYVSTTSNLVSNAVIRYTLLKNLELKSSFGYTNTQTDEIQTTPTTFFDPGYNVPSGASSFNSMNSHSWIIEPQADYRIQLEHGVLTAMIGVSFQESNSRTSAESGSGFISDALLEDIQAASHVSANSNSSQYKYEAIFGRLNYDWMDKYLVNITARRDGTSRFGPGKQFGDFGAVGAAWIFTKEEFMKESLGFLSFGKLRASYGTTGNDQVGDYKFLDLYTVTYYPYQNAQGLYPSNLFNQDLAWETTRKLEGGIELGFLKDKITVQASFFRNRSGNQLVQTPVSQVTGFSAIPSNLPALVQNTGQEFILNSVNVITKNFEWTSSLNLTVARNKLIAFPGLANSPYANSLIVGQPVTIRQLFKYMGVNDTTGVYQFAAAHGVTTYNPDFFNDPRSLVDLTPRFYGGFQNNFSYKGVSLDIFFQFIKQRGQKLFYAYGGLPGTMYNEPTDVLDHWQKPGDKKTYQRFTQDYGSDAANAFGYIVNSDFAYEDASFIRLKNLAISWQLPGNWKKKMRLENCRVYVQGQNLLTLTAYKGVDPESQGISTGPTRVWTAGLQLGW